MKKLYLLFFLSFFIGFVYSQNDEFDDFDFEENLEEEWLDEEEATDSWNDDGSTSEEKEVSVKSRKKNRKKTSWQEVNDSKVKRGKNIRTDWVQVEDGNLPSDNFQDVNETSKYPEYHLIDDSSEKQIENKWKVVQESFSNFNSSKNQEDIVGSFNEQKPKGYFEDDITGIEGVDGQSIPSALREYTVIKDEDRDWSDLFYRIPLNPPMSNNSWMKWMGSKTKKVYKVRKGDNLWCISSRLFGNPYLWPKIWQLNAYIGNPNIIEPGMKIEFDPQNPFSSLKFVGLKNRNLGPMPPLRLPSVLTEQLDPDFFEDTNSKDTSYSYNSSPRELYLKKHPKYLAKIPRQKYNEKLFFTNFDKILLNNLDPGSYFIYRMRRVKGGYSATKIARIEMEARYGKIMDAAYEIRPGDIVTSHQLTPINNSVEVAHVVEGKDAEIVFLDRSLPNIFSSHQAIGLRFKSSKVPTIGSRMILKDKVNKIADIELISVDGRLATGWVHSVNRESKKSDYF